MRKTHTTGGVNVGKKIHQAWNVYLHGKLIDTVFNDPRDTREEVKKSLVNHDGYDSEIIVKKA
jgi:hypothetical protein